MKFHIISLCLLLGLSLQSVSSQDTSNNADGEDNAVASLPPRGWNSYDSFSWIVSENEFLQNADILSKRLRQHGFEYAVVDYLWFRSLKGGNDSLGFDTIDPWGRMLPDPERFPSSKGGNGFKKIADIVHGLGLKFGIHLMGGLSTQAFNNNTPILDTTTGKAYEEAGRVWHAKDIGIEARRCKWMKNGFMGINTTTVAGKAFLRSIYELYASWGVDFVKLDCVFGDDFDLGEITSVSQILKELNHSIVFSLSPGVGATPVLARNVTGLVNMYRVTGDDWDKWEDIASHFDVARDFAAAKLIGAEGLHEGKSWPDLDMLPLGWLTEPGVPEGPHRNSRLTLDEQRTQMTLWSMAKSPIMYGGDLRKIDDFTFALITNPTLLEIDAFSSNNGEFPNIVTISKNSTTKGQIVGKSNSTYSLSLTECTDPKASGWYNEKIGKNSARICYKEDPEKDDQVPFCLHKRQLPTAPLDQENGNTTNFQLVDINRKQHCLDAYPKRKLTASEKKGKFSPCKSKPNQMWRLNKSDGTLVNAQSGKCATLQSVQAKVDVKGTRSWVATGRHGETYLAFFNLNRQSTTIVAQISDLYSTLFPGKKVRGCSGNEIWSGKIVSTTTTLSADLSAHGCALFVLKCS